jgi:hypothetical protein
MLGWERFPELDPALIKPRLIFGHSNGFAVRFHSEDDDQTDSPNPTFQGRARDVGEHEATVRFTRVTP